MKCKFRPIKHTSTDPDGVTVVNEVVDFGDCFGNTCASWRVLRKTASTGEDTGYCGNDRMPTSGFVDPAAKT